MFLSSRFAASAARDLARPPISCTGHGWPKMSSHCPAAPSGSTAYERATLSYAMIQDVNGFTGGTVDGRQGQLRDSDATVGYVPNDLHNYAVAFVLNVP